MNTSKVIDKGHEPTSMVDRYLIRFVEQNILMNHQTQGTVN